VPRYLPVRMERLIPLRLEWVVRDMIARDRTVHDMIAQNLIARCLTHAVESCTTDQDCMPYCRRATLKFLRTGATRVSL